MLFAYYLDNYYSSSYLALIKVLKTLGVHLDKCINNIPGSKCAYIIIPPDMQSFANTQSQIKDKPLIKTAILARKTYPVPNRFLYYYPVKHFKSNEIFSFEKKGLTVVTDLVSLLIACSKVPRPLEDWEIEAVLEPILISDIRRVLHALKSEKRNDQNLIILAQDCINKILSGDGKENELDINQMEIKEIENILRNFYERRKAK